MYYVPVYHNTISSDTCLALYLYDIMIVAQGNKYTDQRVEYFCNYLQLSLCENSINLPVKFKMLAQDYP